MWWNVLLNLEFESKTSILLSLPPSLPLPLSLSLSLDRSNGFYCDIALLYIENIIKVYYNYIFSHFDSASTNRLSLKKKKFFFFVFLVFFTTPKIVWYDSNVFFFFFILCSQYITLRILLLNVPVCVCV